MTDLDIVVFGATGYVGRLVAEHLAATAPVDARIGLAGRSKDKLQRVADDLALDWPLLVVDAAAPQELTEQARVVCTTVGPYARYGMPLVQACARSGTDYLDLTGETLFVRAVIDSCHDLAVASDARLVPSCGYDAIPSDLAVLLLSERAQAEDAGGLGDTTLVASFKGGVSGGTVDSMRVQVDTVARDPASKALVEDPYALSPDRTAEPDLGDERDSVSPERDQRGRWTAPFVMGPYNARLVRRSNALSGYAYGRSLRYRERMSAGEHALAPVIALGAAATLRAAVPAMSWGPTRVVLDKVLPDPGAGPSQKQREQGWFRMETDTRTSSGARYRAVVAGSGDPGYAATAVMMGQSALTLAFDTPVSEGGGVLTPATALGGALVERLRAQGMELGVSRLPG